MTSKRMVVAAFQDQILMGITEEGGKVASGIVEALKTQPALLVLFICNVGMLVFLFYALAAAGNFRTLLIKQNFDFQREMLGYQKQIADILSHCVIPQKAGEQALPLPIPINE